MTITKKEDYTNAIINEICYPEMENFNDNINLCRFLSTRPFYTIMKEDERFIDEGTEYVRNCFGYNPPVLEIVSANVLETLYFLATSIRTIAINSLSVIYDCAANDITNHLNIRTVSQIFWELLDNLNIYPKQDWDRIVDRLNNWMQRKFNYNGVGSPFPIKNAKRNQTKISMRQQIGDYIFSKN